MTRTRPRFYPGIEILRGAAALSVVGYHVIVHGGWESFPQSGALRNLRVGWLGVDLFLVISGFVITSTVIAGIDRTPSLREFRRAYAARRWRRIAPLYFLTLLVFLLLVQPDLLLQSVRTLAFHLGMHGLFLHNLLEDTHGSIDGVNWTVALEMQFYVLMMLAGPWIVRQRPALVVTGLAGAAIAFRAVVFGLLGGVDAEVATMLIYTSQLPGTLDEFGVGIALALVVASASGSKATRSRWLEPSWPSFVAWSLVAAGLAAVTMGLYWDRAAYWDHWTMVIGWRTLLAVALGAIVLAAITLPPALVGPSRPLRYLGEISYGIYLWHLPVLLTLISSGLVGSKRLLALTVVGTIALASFSWHVVEKPYLRRRSTASTADSLPTGWVAESRQG